MPRRLCELLANRFRRLQVLFLKNYRNSSYLVLDKRNKSI